MNRFRKTKKGKDNDGPEAIPPHSTFMGISMSKKSKEVVEPEFDLSDALPSADNFRTSLLMPNLSARFSMLREQDDPTTKVGKANDDSVLFPKRASRLNLFGHNPNPLSDIVEVSSLTGRSSFTTQRVNSFASAEDGTDSTDNDYQGSIMNRKRPGEGNNLFGGRQKVYKIPISGSGKDTGGMRGRTVYEDDINLSTFQRLRLKEKEERQAMPEEGQDTITPESEDGLPSSMTKRMTSSSTNSGQSNPRTSTAATSIDEQPTNSNQTSSMWNNGPTSSNKINGVLPGSMAGHVSKTRRLYGQGLAQTAHDQQSSALSRLESLSRQRAGAGTPDLPRLNRTFSRSATNLHDRRQGISPTLTNPSSANRNYSPVTSTGSPLSEALDAVHKPDRTSDSSNTATSAYGVVPPLSPPISDSEEVNTLAAALHPEDRGKATAMGLFNKPSGPYDEQQFMRRQLQMHENRVNSPTTRRSSANSISKGEETSGNRPRKLSNTSYRSKAESTTSSAYSGDGPGSRAQSIRDVSPPRAPGSHGTFFLNLDNSDSDSQGPSEDPPPLKKVSSVKSLAFDGIHPAFRSRPVSRDSRDSDNVPSTRESFELSDNKSFDLNPIQETDANPPSPILEEASDRAPDSPTLGPTGLGLTSMIRTHLRHDSTQSVLPLPSPGLPLQNMTLSAVDKNNTTNLHANGSNDNASVVRQNLSVEPPSGPLPPPPTSGFSGVALRAKQLREQAAALREQQSQEEQPDQTKTPMQEQARKLGHARDSSLETQKEREDFAHELAERRKRVQENLHRIDTRSNCPASGRNTPDSIGPKPGNGFSLLKNRSVKNGTQDGLGITTTSSKALKKIGLGGRSMNTSTPSLDSWRDGEATKGLGKHSNSSSPQIATSRAVSGRTTYSRSASHGSQEDDGFESGWSRPESPVTARQDRSASASGRSKSRPQPREDLDNVAEGSVNRYNDAGRSPSVPQSVPPSVDSYDWTSGARKAGVLMQLEGDSNSISSPRPSPAVPPYSANATPPLEEDGRDSLSMLLNYSESMSNAMVQNTSQRGSGGSGLPKRQVLKTQISEPTFVSSTSNVPMVNLPPGASLSNGINTPPIPPMNPRRRRTTSTKSDLSAIQDLQVQTPPAIPSGYEGERRPSHPVMSERNDNTFESQPNLRKMPSEGGFSNSRGRQQVMMAASPRVPAYSSPTNIQGGMI